MNFLEVRPKLGALLAPILDSDPNVLTSLVDAIEPPALMIGWAEPAFEPDTACFMVGHLVITCVAARLMPGEGITSLEELWTYTMGRLRTDTPNWSLESGSGPRVFPIAKTSYIASRIAVRVTLDG